jgi:hypothetical protein
VVGVTAVAARCAHRQAEPVVLSTGEVVASVCIECYAPLSADYIDSQRERAERTAFCEHDEKAEITMFGEAKRSYICIDCGTML